MVKGNFHSLEFASTWMKTLKLYIKAMHWWHWRTTTAAMQALHWIISLSKS